MREPEWTGEAYETARLRVVVRFGAPRPTDSDFLVRDFETAACFTAFFRRARTNWSLRMDCQPRTPRLRASRRDF